MELTITKHHECSPQGKWMSNTLYTKTDRGVRMFLLRKERERVVGHFSGHMLCFFPQ